MYTPIPCPSAHGLYPFLNLQSSITMITATGYFPFQTKNLKGDFWF